MAQFIDHGGNEAFELRRLAPVGMVEQVPESSGGMGEIAKTNKPRRARSLSRLSRFLLIIQVLCDPLLP